MRPCDRKFWVLLFVFGVFGAVTAWAGFYGLSALKGIYRRLGYVSLLPIGEYDYTDESSADGGEGKYRVVMFGDSRVRGWEPLPSVEGAVFINRGLNGHTTGQCRLRLERDVLGERPDAVLIEVGINDIKYIGACENKGEMMVSYIKNICLENIKEIVKRLSEEKIRVVLVTVFPAGKCQLLRKVIWSDRIYEMVDDINEELKGFEGGYVTVVESGLSKEGQRGGRIKEVYVNARDALHINEKGYERVNEAVEPVIEELVNGEAVR